ncbi:hypothetical protein Rsub_07223 [Raphidocelis subcapitata]|uniref:Photosystem II PsbY n=1 Tax=Raphidocelis subcapitata TaxID=307507 RepID=A0A2V0P4A8_9CHLO|nr:hypothetical protein Rsub_07223 [Raphidocelis subcapitata]|eukprot:GBF94409.1 hypothetical protein Rsub_07223 [Raphidocelis subcapitata]
MASLLRASSAQGVAARAPTGARALPRLAVVSRRSSVRVAASASREEQAAKLLALPAAAGAFLAAGNAQAATELAQLAASDSRLGIIALLFLPAIGWVAFNILGPLTNQLSRMSEMNSEAPPSKGASKKRRGVAGAVGLGAALSLAAAQQADAATELAQLSASDSRLGIIALLFLPAIGWVAFNMLGPLTNQLSRMSEMNAEAAPSKGAAAKKRR